MTKLSPILILSIGAIILSISAIATVGVANTTTPDLTDINQRLDNQQAVIMQNRGLIINNTAFNENQKIFNNDVVGWAVNVTAKIDGLANSIP